MNNRVSNSFSITGLDQRATAGGGDVQIKRTASILACVCVAAGLGRLCSFVPQSKHSLQVRVNQDLATSLIDWLTFFLTFRLPYQFMSLARSRRREFRPEELFQSQKSYYLPDGNQSHGQTFGRQLEHYHSTRALPLFRRLNDQRFFWPFGVLGNKRR